MAVDEISRFAGAVPVQAGGGLRYVLEMANALTKRDLDQAERIYCGVHEVATRAGDDGIAMHATLGLLDIALCLDPKRALETGDSTAQQALELFQRRGDLAGLARAWHLRAWIRLLEGHSTEGEFAANCAIALAEQAGDKRCEANGRGLGCIIMLSGPRPVTHTLAYARATLAWAQDWSARNLEAVALSVLAQASAMHGEFGDALRDSAAANFIGGDIRYGFTATAGFLAEAQVAQLFGERARADGTLRRWEKTLQRTGETGLLTSLMALRARLLMEQAHDEEAEELTRSCERLAAPGRLDSQITWRSIRGVLYARRGACEQAVRLTGEAVSLASTTDQLNTRAEAMLDHAEALVCAGRREEAAKAAIQAVRLYQRKGNKTAASAARRRLPKLLAA